MAVDLELSLKIESELQLEQETMDEEKKDLQKSVDDFLESSQFTVCHLYQGCALST
jgi:hypothetical protein